MVYHAKISIIDCSPVRAVPNYRYFDSGSSDSGSNPDTPVVKNLKNVRKKKMKKLLIVLAAVILLFSGCVGQKNQNVIKIGDNVSADYIGYVNGHVFDTTIEGVAKQNNLSTSSRQYKPFNFTVGKGKFIQGIEEGIVGMKVGESKTIVVPPLKIYGNKSPSLIRTFPVKDTIPLEQTFPKVFEIPTDQFKSMFGTNQKIGDNVKVSGTNINLTILDLNKSNNVSVSYNIAVGDHISSAVPYVVIKVDDNITVRSDVKKGQKIQFENVPWNTTVIDIDSNNMTMLHNKIPDTRMQNGRVRVHFNDTYITMDSNNELAGESLTFNVTIRSIN